MDDRNDEQITTLNTLTATLIDSVNGYRDAAEDSKNSRFQEIFRKRADERSKCVEDLRQCVRSMGGDPEDSGSFMGKTHQTFLDLKSAVTGDDQQSIVNEVERGEDYLKDKFQTALDDANLTGEARSTVEQVYQSVKSGHDQMSELKHGMEANTDS